MRTTGTGRGAGANTCAGGAGAFFATVATAAGETATGIGFELPAFGCTAALGAAEPDDFAGLATAFDFDDRTAAFGADATFFPPGFFAAGFALCAAGFLSAGFAADLAAAFAFFGAAAAVRFREGAAAGFFAVFAALPAGLLEPRLFVACFALLPEAFTVLRATHCLLASYPSTGP